MSVDVEETESMCSTDDGSSSSSAAIDIPAEIASMNESIVALGASPIEPRKALRQKLYPEEKVQRICSTLRKRLRLSQSTSSTSQEMQDHVHYRKEFDEVITQLKEKYRSANEQSVKLQVLTVLPKSWSIKRVEGEFGVSNYTARLAKTLCKEKGIMSTPNPKKGRSITQGLSDKVINFYNSAEISREMPGAKDCVSVTNAEGKRVEMQKKLILCNLKEAYEKFKDDNPDAKVGFSKFADLRPKNVVLPGSSGTHSVCVCTIHQNVKLMIEGAKLYMLLEVKKILGCEDFQGNLTYRHFLAHITCNPALPNCFIGECDLCGDSRLLQLQQKLAELFDNFFIDAITYKAWTTVDRTNLETLVKEPDDFFESFSVKLSALKRHDFIAKEQTAYMNSIKGSAMEGTALVIGDFAENYSFVLQDAAQGFHWSSSQATIHPFVVYYMSESAILQHHSFVVISDETRHSTVAVHRFQKELVPHIKLLVPNLSKIIYFSDGAASQYKNRKNFVNIAFHEEDFGVTAEWHFFATSHGKGPCDGVGGTVKRLAAKESLKRIYDDQIQTAQHLFAFAKKAMPTVTFAFVTKEDIANEIFTEY